MEVRAVLIPKPDDPTGAKRLIGVAAAVWRLCSSAMIKNITSWYQAWVHPELYGGVPGVSADDLHNRFYFDLQQAVETGQGLSGCKVDLSKCFDRVSPRLAFAVLRKLGLSREICEFVLQFYKRMRTWFTGSGATAHTFVKRLVRLLQGCPWSVMAVAGIMTVFCHHMHEVEPSVQWGVFIDERLAWTKGRRSVNPLTKAVEAAQEFDVACCFKWNSDKGALFATKNSDLQKLTPLSASVGPVSKSFKNLGLHFVTTRQAVEKGINITRQKAAADVENSL